MITCTSERSGIASKGVRSNAYTPVPIVNVVSANTRNKLRIDQLINAESMSMASVIAVPRLIVVLRGAHLRHRMAGMVHGRRRCAVRRFFACAEAGEHRF